MEERGSKGERERWKDERVEDQEKGQQGRGDGEKWGGGEGGAHIPVQAGKSAHVLCSCWARFFTATLKSRFK